jgi:hypothetical protein
MTVDVRDEPRRYYGAVDLLAQRVPVVWRRLFSRVFRCCGAEEELTPAPRRVLAAPAEHRDQVIPPIRSRGTDIDGHDPTIGPRPARQDFKLHVRRLKELGLTLCLDVGYRLSPRGGSYLNYPRTR